MSIRNRYFLAVDAVLFATAPFLLYALRFEGFRWPTADLHTAIFYAALSLPLRLAILFAFGMYRRLWRYASISELELIFMATGAAAMTNTVLGAIALPGLGLTTVRVPLSVLFGDAMLTVGLVAATRFAVRIALLRPSRGRTVLEQRRVLIAGAGAAGEMVVKELRRNPELGLEPIGFVDDDPRKHCMWLANLRVFGDLSSIPRIAQEQCADEVLIAMPRAPGSVIRNVVRITYDCGLKTRTVPGLFDIISQRVSVASIRDVQIQDLLRREPIQTDLAAVSGLVGGKTVLVTGAGGSIGSELCRQLIAHDPAAILLLGNGENPIFEIQNELRGAFPDVRLLPVIADVRNRDRIRGVIAEHEPHAIFHAAAHKHVPLMEENPSEAVTNNVMGTRNLIEAAVDFDVPHFLLISTDKAVRPTNVMGASKRVAEYVVHNAAIRHHRNFVAVRFGNVLGSQGSVVPTFLRQIKAGGPVTVTHAEMRRYFMTIPEAVQLVLQAATIGRGGELFMLDMGEPVRIVDLARDMIRLSGLDEGDIEIQFTGMRPGEKLYEEMFFSHEVAEPTSHPKILRAKNGVQKFCDDTDVEDLVAVALGGAPGDVIRGKLQMLVPDYMPSSQLNGHGTRTRPQQVPPLRTGADHRILSLTTGQKTA